MFLAEHVVVDADFDAARSGLAQLAASTALFGSARDAYDEGNIGYARLGLAGSRLVRVQSCELAGAIDSTGLAIRWEAAGAGSGLFPVLDADVRLVPAAEHLTLLTLNGSYRPPLGRAGEAVDRMAMHRVATATARGFLVSLAGVLTRQVAESSPRESNA